MIIRSKDRRAIVGSGTVAIFSATWSLIQFVTDAATLPDNAHGFWKFVVTANPMLPWAIFALSVLILAWSLWPRPDETKEEAGSVNWPVASGRNSTSMAGNSFGDNANVSITNVTHPEQTPPPQGPIIRQLSGMEIAASLYRAGARPPKMPIWKALQHIAAVIDDTEDGCPEARRQLEEAAVNGAITLWGRPQIRPVFLNQKMEAGRSWKSIRPEFWDDHTLNVKATLEAEEAGKHTDEEMRSMTVAHDDHWALRVSQEEIEKEWPVFAQRTKPGSHRATQRGFAESRLIEPGDIVPAGLPVSKNWMEPVPSPDTSLGYDALKLADGLHRVLTGQAGGKTPDLPLNGLLARLYKLLGPVPRGDDARSAFYRRVDLAIADKVHLNSLSVWGRKNEEPLNLIWRTHSARFDHRNKCVSVEGTSAIHREVYYDLYFNKAEVEGAWPR